MSLPKTIVEKLKLNASDQKRLENELNAYVAEQIAAQGGSGGGSEPISGELVTTKLTISAAQIADLHNTPVELIATPGVGKYVQPIGVYCVYNYGTVAYNSANVNYRYGNSGSGAGLISSSFMTASNSRYQFITPFLNTGVDAEGQLENLNIEVFASGDLGNSGDGTIEIYFTYLTLDI